MASASDLERGNYFIYNNEPVKVTRKELVTVGTHCHTKLKFYIQGLNGKGEKIVTFSHTDKVEIVEIIRRHGQIISKSDSKVQIMDMVSYETVDAIAGKELAGELNEGDSVTFIDYNGNVQILEKR